MIIISHSKRLLSSTRPAKHTNSISTFRRNILLSTLKPYRQNGAIVALWRWREREGYNTICKERGNMMAVVGSLGLMSRQMRTSTALPASMHHFTAATSTVLSM